MLPASFPRWLGLGMLAASLAIPAKEQEAAPLSVHEWGPFPSLQDDSGHAIGGINVDDEPVPAFVGQIANRTVASQYSAQFHNFGLPPYQDEKGWLAGDPAVQTRLET